MIRVSLNLALEAIIIQQFCCSTIHMKRFHFLDLVALTIWLWRLLRQALLLTFNTHSSFKARPLVFGPNNKIAKLSLQGVAIASLSFCIKPGVASYVYVWCFPSLPFWTAMSSRSVVCVVIFDRVRSVWWMRLVVRRNRDNAVTVCGKVWAV